MSGLSVNDELTQCIRDFLAKVENTQDPLFEYFNQDPPYGHQPLADKVTNISNTNWPNIERFRYLLSHITFTPYSLDRSSDSANNIAIEVCNLNFSFTATRQVKVMPMLRDCSFCIPCGQFWMLLLGPNGCRKSTLLKFILAIVPNKVNTTSPRIVSAENIKFLFEIQKNVHAIRANYPGLMVSLQDICMKPLDKDCATQIVLHVVDNLKPIDAVGVWHQILTEWQINLEEADKWKMSFVMPSKYGADLPLPKDSSVRIKEIPRKIVAVVSFSGFVNDEEIKQRELKLRQALKSDRQFKIKEGSSVEVAQYNPPFTLPFQRRNEIALEVERKNE
ncbi:hypothetical protein PIB30_034118 [Stylosanthes scabra]|uniref:ABC transporter domain-containing protein n=1 Tax=Stylosanthes scabra TaxID=79078 RepID=A0ABU6SCS8_9FABA|nr:hypothetical protein [Stylosanthes scabra]